MILTLTVAFHVPQRVINGTLITYWLVVVRSTVAYLLEYHSVVMIIVMLSSGRHKILLEKCLSTSTTTLNYSTYEYVRTADKIFYVRIPKAGVA